MALAIVERAMYKGVLDISAKFAASSGLNIERKKFPVKGASMRPEMKIEINMNSNRNTTTKPQLDQKFLCVSLKVRLIV